MPDIDQDLEVFYRNLQKTYGLKTNFNKWSPRIISAHNLENNVDYRYLLMESTGGRPKKQIYVTETVTIKIQDHYRHCARILNNNRKEIKFISDLYKVLSAIEIFREDVKTIKEQYVVDSYRLDIFFPTYNLAVEYDETFHSNKTKKEEDTIRDSRLKELGLSIIRVKEGEELEGIGKVIDFLLKNTCVLVNKMT